MDEYYVKLATALRERLDVISDREFRERDPADHLAKLRQASERIEQLKNDLPANADPMLTHYLDRMSLSKALEFVQNRYLR
jgi:hypothetical protein